jgi:hypothetical protein
MCVRTGAGPCVQRPDPVPDGVVAWQGRELVYAGPHSGWEGEVDEWLEGCTLVPGFVDCHTHLPFVGWRDDEFEAVAGLLPASTLKLGVRRPPVEDLHPRPPEREARWEADRPRNRVALHPCATGRSEPPANPHGYGFRRPETSRGLRGGDVGVVRASSSLGRGVNFRSTFRPRSCPCTPSGQIFIRLTCAFSGAYHCNKFRAWEEVRRQ